jgi:tetratricopeptide (TPR) repeat protein
VADGPSDSSAELELTEGAGTDEDALVLELARQEGPATLLDEPPGTAAGPAGPVGPEPELELLPPLPDDDELAAASAAAVVEAPEEIVDEPAEPVATEAELAPRPLEVVPPPAAPPAQVDEEEADLSDEIEEADFFLQQGLIEEAREALENLQSFYPGHRGVLSRLDELARRLAAHAPVAASAGAHPAPGPPGAEPAAEPTFDIGRELADELDAAAPPALDDEFQYSVEDVFNQFKKGVAETVKAEDSETHYDLGIAYKEMGLLDDAVHEFETAGRGTNRKREVDCLSMIGACRLAQGRTGEAIEALRRALRSDHLTKEAARAIQVDLGAAYEAAGEPEVALWFLQKVARADPAYRQAGQRVAALGGGPGRPPPNEAGAAPPTPLPPLVPRPVAAPPAAPGPKKNIGYL